MTLVRDSALVLSRHPWSESSLVVHALTARNGRVHLVARGAYRPTSRYYAVLDVFDELELEWDAVPGRELSNLRAGRVLVRRRAITSSLPAYRAGVALLELADLVARHGAPDPALYALLAAELSALAAETLPPEAELVRFELALLAHLGLSPALEACAMCASPAPPVTRGSAPRAAFSAAAGGRLCARCASEARAAGRRVGTLPCAVLDDGRLLGGERARIPAALANERIDRVRDFVGRFLESHLESRPRSQWTFLSAPHRNAPAQGAGAARRSR